MKLLDRQLLARLGNLKIPSARRLKAPFRGEKVSLRRGSSVEFSDYREYLPGDDIRSIDWNVYARAEKYFLKLFLEEESKPVYFLIDASESMNFGAPSKLHYSLSVAAALSYISLRRYDKPSFVLLRKDSFRRTTIGNTSQFFSSLEAIEQEKGLGETRLTACLRKFALARPALGICFVLSDFFSPDGFDGIKLLSAAGYEVHCLHLLTPEEEKPDLRGDLKLFDSETNDVSEVSISPQILARYQMRLQQLKDTVKNAAHATGARYYSIRTDTPLAQLLFGDFKKTHLLL